MPPSFFTKDTSPPARSILGSSYASVRSKYSFAGAVSKDTSSTEPQGAGGWMCWGWGYDRENRDEEKGEELRDLVLF